MIKDTKPVTWGQTSAAEHPNGQPQEFAAPTHGLNIPLYFSEAGVDPFRQVTWELRTASITNEHGEVVFEQAQVEVPSFWSQIATNVVVSKYFRGALGTPQRENSVKQLISRVANTVTEWGIKDKYFATPQEAENFRAELSTLLLTQRASFNSPVWFNVGIEPHPQCSACFILSVEDKMESILDWYRVEGMIFKYGSGSGINLSPIRSAREPLAGGGTASGPVSFMRAADASAGVIKSGGKTRRAAKMVVLNADHPDIEKFICCKWQEEKKAWTLVDAGYDSSIDGEAYSSVFFQNANNSVRATDEFMKAALEDKPWDLKAVTTAQPFQTVRARELLHLIAEATWNCGDPGMQFDTTINRWHTCPNTGRINASNPCFTGDAKVYTDRGLIPFKELAERVSLGETFRVFTHDATNAHSPAETVSLTRPTQIMQTGVNEVYRLRFSNGIEVTCTKNHRFFTRNRGMVAAEDLQPDDEILTLNQPVEFPASSLAIDADHAAIFSGGRASGGATHGYKPVQLPSVWTTPLAEYLGYLVGDGCIRDGSDSRNRLSTASVVFGAPADAEELAPRFRALFQEMGVEELQEVEMPNGTSQLRVNRTPVIRFFKQLGVSTAKAPEKVIPHTLFKAPKHIVAGFLRGLFTADGCVYDGKKSRYVGLGSVSKQLLLETQQLLASFGIKSGIYSTREPFEAFPYTKRDGSRVVYRTHQIYDLRVSGPSIARFKEQIGFLTANKQAKLDRLIAEHELYQVKETVRLKERTFVGLETTYNLTEPKNHSYIVNSLIVSNCSEYMHLDNSACNLASLNLMRFLDDSGRFKIADFRAAVRTMTIAMDILVDNSSYPTPKITENAKNFRELGLGYANLGALLMSLGVPYDSDEGRAYAATVTALMCGEAYRTSAEISGVKGSYAGFVKNKEPQLHVIRMHRDALIHVDDRIVPEEMFAAAARTWEEALRLGTLQGIRNSQVTVLAPTGTIGFMMDCDTTGVEPDIALIKYKKLVGGGLIKIVNNTVPRALKKLGYSPEQIQAICDYLNKEGMVEGAPGLDPKHLPVFDCAFKPMKGTRSIHYMGHIRMMGAVQPFISGAISKTVNVPPDATVDEIMQSYTEAWKLGVKAVAIYRDGSKRVQPLSTGKTEVAEKESSDPPKHRPQRRYLPDERNALTHKFSIAGHDGYVTVGLYEDGKPGEIFIVMSKEGTVISGLLDAFATAISLALQYGVPLEALVKKFSHMRFEPAGITSNPQIRFAQSILDYVFRWMALKFLPADKQPTPPATVTDLAANQADVTQPNSTAGTGSTLEPSRQAIQSQSFQGQVDAPPCPDCGAMMIRSGSCYKCFNCGATSGCS
ncbi:MAG: ribonucleoside-diphosphate reductase [Candidatus Omnitrophica bacterium]|nr:ribonucleoside-diphosphate reductase [Candidatus Omnitrophota bacterium]